MALLHRPAHAPTLPPVTRWQLRQLLDSRVDVSLWSPPTGRGLAPNINICNGYAWNGGPSLAPVPIDNLHLPASAHAISWFRPNLGDYILLLSCPTLNPGALNAGAKERDA